MFNQAQQSNQSSFRQQMAFVQWLMYFPSLTAMLMFRRNVGYRSLHPVGVLGVFCFMGLIAMWLAQETPYSEALVGFGLVFLWEAVSQRRKRWREIRSGNTNIHSHYIGDSQLRRLWWPGFMRRERRIERFVDPFACLLVGFPIAKYFSPALGGWIVFSGLCLRLIEAECRKRDLARRLDTLDGLIEAEVQAEVVNHFSIRVQQGENTTTTASGIPAGYGADIEQSMRGRKRGRN